jgi:hypothetical protein
MQKPRSSSVELTSDSRTLQVASSLTNGKVLVVGGAHAGTSASAELYDPTTRKWSLTGAPTSQSERLTVLPNGKVLGQHELYDPSTGKWTPTTIPQGVLMRDGKILVDGDPPSYYDLATGRSTPTGPHVFPGRRGQVLTLLLSGKVLLSGGGIVDPLSRNTVGVPAELFDPSTLKWSATAPSHTVDRFAPSSVLLATGKVLLAGGLALPFFAPCGSCGDVGLQSAEVYDPVTGKWSNGGELGYTPNSLTLLANGQVLAAGGEAFLEFGGTSRCDFFSKAQLFNPQTQTWAQTGSLTDSSGRPGHTATLLNDGTVLAAGGTHVVPMPTPNDSCGIASTTVLKSVEVFTPPTTTVLPTLCKQSAAGSDAHGHAFVRVAARDIASGLRSVTVLQSTNATVSLAQFPLGSRDPAVLTVARVDATQPATVMVSATNRAGKTVTCTGRA